jgi:preprotein translocase subunit SecD
LNYNGLMLDFPKWKIFLICAVLVLGIYYALPNFVTSKYLPDAKMNLGLDLQGGSHLLLKIEEEEYFRTQVNNLVDEVRKELRQKDIGYKNLGSDGKAVSFDLRDLERSKEVFSLLKAMGADIVVNNQSGKFSVSFSESYYIQQRAKLIDQSIEIIRRRIDETGTKEPIIQSEGQNRIILQVPGAENPEEIKQKINTTAKLTFHAVMGESPVEPGKVPDPGNMVLPDLEGQYWEVVETATLGGENLVDASQGYDDFGRVAVHFKFDTRGGKIFGDFTRDNVGRLFASVLDGKVISAPRIQEPILGGQGQITGNYTAEEAAELASLLRAGALPASLKILEERTVGASLGADSIEAGAKATLIGSVLIVIFVVATYGFFGLVAMIAVFFNVVLIFAVLSIMGATLTLPGIAGIALTIGMAVDANVLIFERMREEISKNQKVHKVVESGYSKAFGTILDSNLTTIAAALVMFSMGSGPVKGFAVTLTIGIISSMFTALLVTRLITVIWLKRRRPKEIRV